MLPLVYHDSVTPHRGDHEFSLWALKKLWRLDFSTARAPEIFSAADTDAIQSFSSAENVLERLITARQNAGSSTIRACVKTSQRRALVAR